MTTTLLSDLCLLLADIFPGVLREDYFWSPQLCIAINNLEEVRQYLANLYEILDLEVVVAALEKEHGEESRMKCERTLMTMLQSADEDMRNGIGQVVCHACRLMKGDVHKCIENVVSAPLGVSADQVIVGFLFYIWLSWLLLLVLSYRQCAVLWNLSQYMKDNLVTCRWSNYYMCWNCLSAVHMQGISAVNGNDIQNYLQAVCLFVVLSWFLYTSQKICCGIHTNSVLIPINLIHRWWSPSSNTWTQM